MDKDYTPYIDYTPEQEGDYVSSMNLDQYVDYLRNYLRAIGVAVGAPEGFDYRDLLKRVRELASQAPTS